MNAAGALAPKEIATEKSENSVSDNRHAFYSVGSFKRLLQLI
jgi:hypothetical protein